MSGKKQFQSSKNKRFGLGMWLTHRNGLNEMVCHISFPLVIYSKLEKETAIEDLWAKILDDELQDEGRVWTVELYFNSLVLLYVYGLIVLEGRMIRKVV